MRWSLLAPCALVTGCFQLDPLPAATDGGTQGSTSSMTSETSSSTGPTTTATATATASSTTTTTGPTTSGPSSGTDPTATDTAGWNCPSMHQIPGRVCFLEEVLTGGGVDSGIQLVAGPTGAGQPTGLNVVARPTDTGNGEIFVWVDPLFGPPELPVPIIEPPYAALGAPLAGPMTWEFLFAGGIPTEVAKLRRMSEGSQWSGDIAGCGEPVAVALLGSDPATANAAVACRTRAGNPAGVFVLSRAGMNFGAAVPIDLGADSVGEPIAMTFGDVTGDGLTDLIVSGKDALNCVHVLQMDGVGQLIGNGKHCHATVEVIDVALIDLGTPRRVVELARAEAGMLGGFSIYRVNGNLDFVEEFMSPPNLEDAWAMALGDFDDDDKTDVAAIRYDGKDPSAAQVVIWLQNSPTDWTMGAVLPLPNPAAFDMVVGDFDPGPGDDLAFLNEDGVYIWRTENAMQ